GKLGRVHRVLKPKHQCGVEIADVFAWGRLLEKIAREEIKVTGNAGDVRRKNAIQNQAELIPHEFCDTEIPKTNLKSNEVVDAIMNGATPIKRHFKRNRHFSIKR